MTRADPIKCLNGFYTAVKVQNVPSDMEMESIFMMYRPGWRRRESWLWTV